MRTLHVAFLAAVTVSIALVVTEACSQNPSDSCTAEANCPSEDSGSFSEAGVPDGTVADRGDGATCDPTQTPAESPCVISDTLAIFVGPSGSDTNPGTKEEPALTIGHGLTLALTTSTHRVIACASTYAESLSLTAPADDLGIALFGGVLCPGGGNDAGAAWTYTGAQAVVQAVGPGPALQATGLTQPLTLEDVELDGPTVTSPGSSSIGAFVSNVMSAIFTNVKLVAQSGVNGADGTTGDNYADGGVLSGNTATDAGPGAAQTCTCQDGTQTTGGAGGFADAGAGPGLPSWGAGAAGQNNLTCTGGGFGFGGASAPAAALDGGAAPTGTLGALGWTPGNGATGHNGPQGQGGGGGGDGQFGGAGGGGACGGCGGAGGTGGQAGGSSIALLAYQSVVTLTKCQLVAGNAGAGGTGASGQAGQSGNNGGNGAPPGASGGCSGGAGGNGAGGNGGGGGAGGISAGVAYVGTPTTIDGTSTPSAATLMIATLGSAGSAGALGDAGAAALGGNPGSAGLPGAPGISQAVVQVQ